MRAWRLAHAGGHFTLEGVPRPQPRACTVVARVDATPMLTYFREYASGKLSNYRMPRGPFTPGTNAVGVIEAVGADVHQLQPGQRVALSPHVVSGENVEDPVQVLAGWTSSDPRGDPLLESFRDGTLAEYTLLPVTAVTPLDGLDAIPAPRLATIGKFIVPFGGLLRGRLAAGDALVVNGATGYYGSAVVLLGKAMGAGRVVAAGRNAAALREVVSAAGDRVQAVVLAGDAGRDAEALREAAGGGAAVAFDMVGRAADPSSTLAALRSLRRGGRLVLMGSMTVPLPLDYGEVMIHGWEVVGQYMYGPEASRRLVALIRAGLLDLDAVRVSTYPLAEVPAAVERAATSRGLDCTVVLPSEA